MDIGRILSKLDEYLSKNDYSSAEKLLLYRLDEAESIGNKRAILLIKNELMGLYRKLGKEENALKCVDDVLAIIDELNISENVGAATSYLNCATVFKAFGMAEKSILLFEKAKIIYEASLEENDERLGGLYNNMALTLVDLKEFSKADFLFKKALKIMNNIENGKPEAAITYLNMATAAEAQLGLENAEKIIDDYLGKASVLLDESISDTDGNYAFVCEKCSSVFEYYGHFLYKKELERRARKIYERS